MFDLLELLKVILQGIVEGITEWLPISSTGHMLLLDELLPMNVTPEFKNMFIVVIQLGAILAVCLLYFNKLNPLSPSKSSSEKKATWLLWSKVIVASIPAVLFGAALNDIMDKYFYNPTVIAIALIFYGLAFIWIEDKNEGKHSHKIHTFEALTYRDAFMIGLFQTLALVPGTSRSGSTILGALLLGTSRYIATEFSFFMSIPIMFGASFKKLLDFGFHFTSAEAIYLATGMGVAFIVSIIAIKFLLSYLKRHDFKAFGYYRIALGALVLLYFLVVK
ncbi:undecaprenyl-diphosphate phosphatase [Vaginisenegalia massiliensis]|uniref:undecaprenyl-diphosphate phosphatase n=1 Tax=Vaginisenegalia massiliensis TaxID=2058294 RepID=UPI000F51C40B|nr:undecaprenyl-diphosphate phosphatase [Vaginisenegalia massiliensis]